MVLLDWGGGREVVWSRRVESTARDRDPDKIRKRVSETPGLVSTETPRAPDVRLPRTPGWVSGVRTTGVSDPPDGSAAGRALIRASASYDSDPGMGLCGVDVDAKQVWGRA